RDTRIPVLSLYENLGDWLAERPWEKPLAGNSSSNQKVYWNAYSGLGHVKSPLLVALDNVRSEGSLTLLSALGQPVVLAVGCERGWSDRERDELEKAGFLRLSMGSRALRTETACVAAAVLALEKIGALG
ncbi:MAG: 16S rRNA (uracil(1498)-N(3))-methyltransferase, partial [Treponema sp.]|nr:16S rRNA (uracil(1498)-N(3))-methyltransferase [Treponema sp.]